MHDLIDVDYLIIFRVTNIPKFGTRKIKCIIINHQLLQSNTVICSRYLDLHQQKRRLRYRVSRVRLTH